MVYIKEDSLIKDLNLSTRSYKALQAHGILTVHDLLAMPKFELLKIPNLGSTSLAEVSKIILHLKNSHPATRIKDSYYFLDQDGSLHNDFNLSDLPLSSRCINRLASVEIFSLKSLLDTSLIDLKNIPHFGKNCLSELESLFTKIEILRSKKNNQGPWTPEYLCTRFITLIHQHIEKTSQLFYKDLLGLCQKKLEKNSNLKTYHELFNDPEFLADLYALPSFETIIQNHLVHSLRLNRCGLRFDEILSLFPPLRDFRPFLKNQVAYLENKGDILERKNLYYPTFPSILDNLTSFFKEREVTLYKMRIQGATLQEIGNYTDLSRERVRQILIKMNSFLDMHHIQCKEDSLRHFLQKYDLDENTFSKIFLNQIAYGYIQTRFDYKSTEKLPLEFLLEDENMPEYALENLKTILADDYVQVEEGFVEKSKFAIHRYLLKKYVNYQTTIEDYYKIYQDFMVRHMLDRDPHLMVLPHNLMNKLSAENEVLWSFGKKFRYYPFYDYDFSPFLEALNLKTYQDVEYSSKYFFLKHRDLMKNYGIYDEYELHNLLRKICSKKDYPHIHFLRMPNIRFGKGRREKQILDLLEKHSPINTHDLAKLYEKTYGVNASSVLGSYLKDLTPYYQNGIYDIHRKSLPPEICQDFKKDLDQDFYFIKDIINQFKKAYPNLDPSLINSRSLDQLGFKTYQDYCISNNYRYAQDFFRSVLLEEDKYPVDKFTKDFWLLSSATSNFYWLKKNFLLFQYDKDTILTMSYLKNLGITKEDLLSYLERVQSLVPLNTSFTLPLLREKMKDHPLHHYPLPNSFYVYLLDDHIKDLYIETYKDSHILYRGNTVLVSKKK